MRRLGKSIIIGGITCFVFLAVAWWASFYSSSFCTVCGQELSTTEWQVPLTQITYWRWQRLRNTPLSDAISRQSVAGKHEHAWSFAHGGGNGVMCAIGQGRHLVTAALSPDIANFVDAVAIHQGRSVARAWVAMLLAPDQSMRVSTVIRMADVPASGFADREQFQRWWQEHRTYFATLLDRVPGETQRETTSPSMAR